MIHLLLAVARAATFEVPGCGSDPEWGPLADPGRVALSHRSVASGAHFGADPVTEPALAIEFAVPAGVTIPGRGLPPIDDPLNPLPVHGYDQDRSVVQLELPSRGALPLTDEEGASHSEFSGSKFCLVDDPACLWDGGAPANGLWRAWRVRPDTPVAGTCTVTEVQLARTLPDELRAAKAMNNKIALWLDEGEALLAGDRLRYRYVGFGPSRATSWTGRHFRPNFRYATETCPTGGDGTWPRECWVFLAPTQIDDLEVRPGPPAFVRVVAPLDVQAGTTHDVRVVVVDDLGNPSPITTPAGQEIVLRAKDPAGRLAPWSRAVSLTDDWTAIVPVTFPRAGAMAVHADLSTSVLPAATPIHAWTRVTVDPPRFVRKSGDVHFHTGVLVDADTEQTWSFLDSYAPGDHASQSTSTWDAYRYLEEVMGHDFGAASEHAVGWASWTVPSGAAFDPFRAGGACDVQTGEHPYAVAHVGDWWTEAQRLSARYDHTGFVTFPAYEWHSEGVDGNVPDTRDAPLHRVVMFRDFSPADDLPMLPGTKFGLPPQCLLLWLRAMGYDRDPLPPRVQDVVVMPHMMNDRAANLDWDMTYDWSGEFSAMLALLDPDPEVARGLIGDLQRITEVFSQINPRGDFEFFEGDWTTGPPTRHSVRYALAQGARVGLIGGSDNHDQVPGGNDDWTLPPNPVAKHAHEPGGLAFALVEADAPTDRDGIFDAFRARRTYATSGIRAWLDVRLSEPGGRTVGPGLELETDACTLDLKTQLMTGRPIRRVELLQAEVLQVLAGGSTSFSTTALTGGLPSEVFDQVTPIAHPGVDQTRVYYVRGIVGATAKAEDAVWSSPIWVTWTTPCVP